VKDSKLIRMRLDQLQPHPLQSDVFVDCNQEEDRAMTEDIKARGQLQPIEVMPPGNAAGLPANTMLDGHRRRRLMMAAGLTAAEVVVRHDLVDAGADSVAAVFLKSNHLRRQLDSFEMADIARRLFAIECGRAAKRLSPSEMSRMKKRIGDLLGMQPKTLERHLTLLEGPKEVREAVRTKRLNLTLGVRVANLPADRQREVVAQIAGLTRKSDVHRVVEKFLEPSRYQKSVKIDTVATGLVSYLGNVHGKLAGHAGEVSPYIFTDNVKVLRQFNALLVDLLVRAQVKTKPRKITAGLEKLRRRK
jgi:ParB-like chromosome segregation protein Spo0J